MFRKQLSYHICDFLVNDKNEIIILELGEALYNSNFDGHDQNNPTSIQERIWQHIAVRGKIKYDTVRIRNARHGIVLQQWDECFSSIEESERKVNGTNLASAVNLPTVQYIHDDPRHHHLEYIQELNAQKQNSEAKENSIVLGGTIDALLLCDIDKTMLHMMLSIVDLAQLQPWTFFCDFRNLNLFKPPENIEYFIIKPSNGSLGAGTLVVSRKDLYAVLTAIEKRSLSNLLPPQKQKYEEQLKYYFQPQEHINLLIQELRNGKKYLQNGKYHQSTARAVFAVEKDTNKVKIDLVSVFWKLARESSSLDDEPTTLKYISATGQNASGPKINYWPDMTDKERKDVDPLISQNLQKMMEAIHKIDIKDFILKLYQDKQFHKISYYLQFHANKRVDRLDAEFIDIILKVDEGLALKFLIDQAKRYAFGFFLVHPQIELKNWIMSNLKLFNQELLNDLKKFLQEQLEDSKKFPDHEKYLVESQKYIHLIHEQLLIINNKKSVPTLRLGQPM